MSDKLKWLEQLANNEIDLDSVKAFLKNQKDEESEVKQEVVVKDKEQPSLKTGRMFRVQVSSADGDKVNIKVPLNLAKMVIALKPDLVKNQAFKDHDIDLEQIIELLDSDAIGNIVDIESADGDVVKIFID